MISIWPLTSDCKQDWWLLKKHSSTYEESDHLDQLINYKGGTT